MNNNIVKTEDNLFDAIVVGTGISGCLLYTSDAADE